MFLSCACESIGAQLHHCKSQQRPIELWKLLYDPAILLDGLDYFNILKFHI